MYQIILWLVLPLVWLRLQWRGRKEPGYAVRQSERFGRVPPSIRPHPVWFHTVSAGESIAAAPLVQTLQADFPELPFLMTTMTPTGSGQVRQRLPDVDHCYAPYDFGFAVRRFFTAVQPRMLVLMETELWPNLIAEAHRLEIPVLLINARLSARSARGYEKVWRLTHRMLSHVRFIACQSEQHQRRFIELGANPQTVETTGSVKFDVSLPVDFDATVMGLQKAFAWDDAPVWIAASTHPGEDEIVLKTHLELIEKIPGLKLLLVPRHPVRTDEVCQLVKRSGLTAAKQSELVITHAADVAPDVVVGDLMGTLLYLYGVAQVAFVGGSFVEVGGHNPIEPALCGIPSISGPHQFNFTDVMSDLERVGGHVTARKAEQLEALLAGYLLNPTDRATAGDAAMACVAANRGASARVLELLRSRITLAQ
ncbi:MAG: 3-deoxy-D-manno-octulosonic acid transferase [Gammaproteobacteria bacterium]|nr:3-deoxy-D-manno-octulosonic acid transferase [Gammaproteobacteria bacterium]